MLEDNIQKLVEEAKTAFLQAQDSQTLYEQKVQFLGKQGRFSLLMRELGQVSAEEKPKLGKVMNLAKGELENIYSARESEIKQLEIQKKLQAEKIDLTLPGEPRLLGAIHPISQVIQQVVDILSTIGFSVRVGPDIEKDWYNFEALNLPPEHPARDMQDTFYIDDTHVLRTHVSPIQIRTLETEKPPFRVLGPGATFRNDSDISHSPHFHQIEGMLVESKTSMAELRGTIAYFFQQLFGKETKTRLRPSFFPFTEPSAEVDCSCPLCKGKGCSLCKNTGWLEMGGSGLVHPNVFKAVGVEYPKWQGFAFGFGIERMAMVKYRIGHIRLYSENDVRFLEQFRA